MWTTSGNICDWCESPHVMTKVQSAYGLVELCWNCTHKAVCPTYRLEEHHAPFSDHVGDKIDAQLERDGIKVSKR